MVSLSRTQHSRFTALLNLCRPHQCRGCIHRSRVLAFHSSLEMTEQSTAMLLARIPPSEGNVVRQLSHLPCCPRPIHRMGNTAIFGAKWKRPHCRRPVNRELYLYRRVVKVLPLLRVGSSRMIGKIFLLLARNDVGLPSSSISPSFPFIPSTQYKKHLNITPHNVVNLTIERQIIS